MALQASEERYRTLADFLPVMVFETTPDGMLTFGNRLILPVFGIDPAAIGSNINVFDFIVPEERERAYENMQKLFAGIPRSSNEYTLLSKDKTPFPTMITASAVLDEKTGKPIGMRGVIIDLTERKEAEKALQESEELFRALVNNANDAIFLHEMQKDGAPGQYLMVNDVACSLLGYTRDELLTMSPFEVITPTHAMNIPAINREVALRGSATFDATYRNKDGTEINVEINTHLFELHGRKVSLAIARDNTDRKLAEDAMQTAYFELEQKVDERTAELSRLTINLRDEIAERNRVMEALRISEEKYRSLVEQSNDLVFHINEQGILTYISPNILSILGLKAEEIIGNSPTRFMPEPSQGGFYRLHERNISLRTPVTGIELAFYDKERKLHVFEINGTPHFSHDETFVGFSGIARDITDRKALQDQISTSLKEKEILLKEIHHRVKKNMQVISSLLSLQAKMIKDDKSREAIKESQNRVMSIALVHEKLYQSESLAKIDYSEYLRKMVKNLLDSYSVQPGKIDLVIEAGDIVLPINKAIPVSLIINELLSNSLKYAFPKGEAGVVGISFKREGEQYFLNVWDTGVGLPAGFTWDKSDTLGLQLVSSLVGRPGQSRIPGARAPNFG